MKTTAKKKKGPSVRIVPGLAAPGKTWLQHREGDGGHFDRAAVAARLDRPRALEAYFLRNL
jgi:hypothetical protein